MKMIGRTGIIIPLLMLAAAGVWLYLAVADYGIWNNRSGPLGGFFPAIIAVVLFFFALFALVSGIREKPVEYNKRIAIPFACVLAMIAGSYVIGLFPIMTIYLFAWLRYAGKYSIKRTSIITVLMIAGLYAIFAMWLQVSFPAGIIYEILYRRA